MHFSLISALAVAASLLPIANAVNVVGYSNTVSCSAGGGTVFVCSNLAAWSCCGPFPTGYGYSVQFENLPAGTKGQGYRDTACSSYIFTLYGSGTKCWNGGGSERTRSVNWFYDSSRRGLQGGSNAECVSPDEFRYTGDDGVEHRVKIPAGEGEAQKVADAYAAKDFKALAAYDQA